MTFDFARFATGNKEYPYEYFCAANTVLYFNGMPALEVAGLTYAIREGKRPIYGYSSRHFDGVARGQVLVEGTILVNLVKFAYLMSTINGENLSSLAASSEGLIPNSGISSDPQSLEMPHDRGVGFTLKVLMGEQEDGQLYSNKGAGFLITGITFTGEGASFNYDSEVIVKAHNFIARNIVPIR